MLRVVADANIPGIAEAARALPGVGEVVILPSRELNAAAVREADLLFVRSTVKCGAGLLGDSRVRFVATATIGTDHLDLPWLHDRGIAVASAPGSNASAVSHWLVSALLRVGATDPGRAALTRGGGPVLRGLVAGVVGVGNVGRLVAPLLEALGAEVWLCDPPRSRAEPDFPHRDLDELCAGCDVLTLHVPLLRDGPDRTVRLLGADRLRRLRPGSVVVNASRGEVVDGDALRAELEAGRLHGVLDVFPGEPSPDPGLVRAARLATPHIAGHSLEGKVNGTVMVYRAAAAQLGAAPEWTPGEELLPRHPLMGQVIDVPSDELQADELLAELLRGGHDIGEDDAALRRIVELLASERGAAFLRYREGYPIRRELRGVDLSVRGAADSRLAAVLRALRY